MHISATVKENVGGSSLAPSYLLMSTKNEYYKLTPANPSLRDAPLLIVFTISSKRVMFIRAIIATWPSFLPSNLPTIKSIYKYKRCANVLCQQLANPEKKSPVFLIRYTWDTDWASYKPVCGLPISVCLQTFFRTLRVQAATYAISGPNLNDCPLYVVGESRHSI